MAQKNKFFISLILIAAALFSGFHIFCFFIYGDLKGKEFIGNLGRWSKYSNIYHKRPKYYNDLPRKHKVFFSLKGDEEIEIMVFGDSFSMGGAFGKNAFYQDYLASKLNKEIVHFNVLHDRIPNYAGLIANLLKHEKFNKTPKYFILQSVDVLIRHRFMEKFNLDEKFDLDQLILDPKDYSKVLYKPNLIFDKNNYSLLKNSLYKLYYGKDRCEVENATDMQDKVKFFKLTKDFFSVKEGDLLTEDLVGSNPKAYYMNEERITRINNNLNSLANLLAQKNIKLIFLPVPNKFTLYYDYIEDKEGLQKTIFFETLESMDNKNYIYINSYKILKQAIDKGIKDIYYADDTHWTYKASDIITDEIIREIKEYKNQDNNVDK